jgi:hypothetical protein
MLTIATVVKDTTNLIVYPGLGSDRKLNLTTKLNVEATVTLSKFLKIKSILKKSLE